MKMVRSIPLFKEKKNSASKSNFLKFLIMDMLLLHIRDKSKEKKKEFTFEKKEKLKSNYGMLNDLN